MKKHLFILISIFYVITCSSQTPTLQWAKAFGGPNNDNGMSIASTTAGEVYATGFISGTVDLDPGPGVYTVNANSGNYIFVEKLDAAGNFLWASAFGTASVSGIGHEILTDAAGNVLITGWFQG